MAHADCPTNRVNHLGGRKICQVICQPCKVQLYYHDKLRRFCLICEIYVS